MRHSLNFSSKAAKTLRINLKQKGFWLFCFVFTLSVSLSLPVFAQAPQGLSYQAVARDNSGQLLPNQQLGLRISILNGSSLGPVVYQETFTPKTNSLGLFTLAIGYGTATSGNFDAINWGSGLKYLKVEMDPLGGTTYSDLGTTELMSVPYALYSSKSGNPFIAGKGISVSNDTISNTLPDQKITLTGTGNTSISGTYPDFTIHTDVPPAYLAGTGINLSGTTFSAQNTKALWNADQLQGKAVSPGIPTNGEVLKWNSSLASWEPGTDSTTTYVAGTGITINGTTINADYTAGTGINISNGVINSAWTYNSGSNDISNSNSGNVGIGKNPFYSLDVNGPINTDSIMFGGITVLSDKGFNSLFIGQGAGSKNSGNNNYFSGFQSGFNNSSGNSNSFSGYQSGFSNTTGASNQFEGYQAGYSNTTGSNNCFSGNSAGSNTKTGSGNTAVGATAGATNTTGNNNTFIGNGADATKSGLTNATAIGFEATVSQSNSMILGLNANIGIGTSNPANLLSVGSGSLFQVDDNGNIVRINGVTYSFPNSGGAKGQALTNDGTGNLGWTGVATTAGTGLTLSSGVMNSVWSVTGTTDIDNNNTGNVGIGKAPSYRLDVKGPMNSDSVMLGGVTVLSTKGTNNIFVGQKVGNKNTIGVNNLFAGYQAGNSNTSGSEEQFEGYQAGYSNTSGNNNQFIGYQAGYSNKTGASNVLVGYSAGYNNTTGTANTMLGALAGSSYAAYINCTFIGDLADASSTGLANATAIGYNSTVGASNTMSFGAASVTAWAFGIPKVTNTGYALQVGSGAGNGNGAYLTTGGAWTNASDRNKKENFITLDGADILDRICRLPITRWNYKGEQIINTHIGPMAQDFYKMFHTGNDSLAISSIDPAGVALVGVQQLQKENEALKLKLEKLENQNAAQQSKIDSMASEMDEIKSLLNNNTSNRNASATELSATQK